MPRRAPLLAVLLVTLGVDAAPALATDAVPMLVVAVPGGVRERLRVAAPDLDPRALDDALRAHATASARGELIDAPHPERVVVIDYSRSSREKRLWVLDVAAGAVLFHELVAHGSGSGDDLATAFGNDEGSHQTSLGVFRTAEVYVGKHGRSLRLDGLEPGVNDRARERAVVVHAADYVSDAYAAEHGRLGRSWGCPAVRPEVSDALVDAIRGGCLLVAWYPDEAWRAGSPYLR